MAETWHSDDLPEPQRLGIGDWLIVVLRVVPLSILVFGGLLLLLAVRLFERPIYGTRRPVTPHMTQFVCRNALFILGLRYDVRGKPMAGPGAVVANHASWLDIFALNGHQRVYFVAKSEVAKWPGIGWLARATGTLFIRRDRLDARSQVAVFRERLAAGHKLLFFPEGTSSDGLRVLPFKPTLFAAFWDPMLGETFRIQPVTVNYTAPRGSEARFYGWWGDMAFAPHLLRTLGARRQGHVSVVYHSPLRVGDFKDRKSLAYALETTVRSGLSDHGAFEGL